MKLHGLGDLAAQAVGHYWRTLQDQAAKQTSGDADRGSRSAVTGGKQMAGFCTLVSTLLQANGFPKESIHLDSRLDLPGYFRATKIWDLVLMFENRLVAAVEFKSQKGPSFGNNFNNRTEEAIGTAQDIWTAYREGAFGPGVARPWIGWLMLLERSDSSLKPVDVKEPHFKVFPEFRKASYAKRYELLARKLVLERLYDSTAFLLASAKDAKAGRFEEPANDLTLKQFVASLISHAIAFTV